MFTLVLTLSKYALILSKMLIKIGLTSFSSMNDDSLIKPFNDSSVISL